MAARGTTSFSLCFLGEDCKEPGAEEDIISDPRRGKLGVDEDMQVSPTVTVAMFIEEDGGGWASLERESENLRSRLWRSGVETEEGIVGLIFSSLLEGEFILLLFFTHTYSNPFKLPNQTKKIDSQRELSYKYNTHNDILPLVSPRSR